MSAKDETTLEEHSKAKVELYGKYLSIYLNVLSRARFNKVHIMDLFAGEGVYKDGSFGSPLVAIERIKRHFFANNKTCPNILLLFNDCENSRIEPEKAKIDRIKDFADKQFKPDCVQIFYNKTPYEEIVAKVIEYLHELPQKDRALLFIDPWGYKAIRPEDIKLLLQNGHTELLLFLPIYHMYRFANKALTDSEDFHGGKPLAVFLNTLFGDERPNTNSNIEFIKSLRIKFREYTQVKYVDTFVIEREKGNFFCLFFFTNSTKGYEKMLEAKWSMDEESGRGFVYRMDREQLELFEVVDTNNYAEQVREYIAKSEITNVDLFEFGLEHQYLPKHTNQVLQRLQDDGVLEIISLDGLDVKGYYIGNEKRLVLFKLKRHGTIKN